MSILTRLFERRKRYGAGHDFWYGPLPTKVHSGTEVDTDSALQTAAVFACVRLLSETIGSLPLNVFRRTADRKLVDRDHQLHDLLHFRPNPEQSRHEFFSTMTAHRELRGNAYAEIERDPAGSVIALWPLHPDRMIVQRDRDSGVKTYLYTLANGKQHVFPSESILHFMNFSLDGLTGIDPIRQCAESIGLSLATQQHAASFFGNSARPGGVLTTPNKLRDEARANLKKSWQEAHQGPSNAHRVAVLEEGLSFTTIGITPEQSQFLETRKFQVSDVARIFGVPAHLVGDLDRATFSNIEHQGIEFVTHTVRPRLTRFEGTMHKSLFKPEELRTHFCEFSADALLRGDTKSRYEAYGSAIVHGWMTRNEIRKLENLNPLDGLDEVLDPVAVAQKPGGGDSNNARAILPELSRDENHDMPE